MSVCASLLHLLAGVCAICLVFLELNDWPVQHRLLPSYKAQVEAWPDKLERHSCSKIPLYTNLVWVQGTGPTNLQLMAHLSDWNCSALGDITH